MIRKFLPLIAILVVIAGGLFGGEMLRGDEADPSAEASGTEG